MARARNIKPGFFTNDVLADIPALGRLLFVGLWTIADRAGRLEDRPKKIKAQILPYDDCDCDALLDILTRHGFIQRYQSAGDTFIQITKWDAHQNPHVKEMESTIPAPDMPDGAVNTDAGQLVNLEAKSDTKPDTKPSHNSSIRPVPLLTGTSTMPAPVLTGSSPADSLNLIPDSLNPLFPDPVPTPAPVMSGKNEGKDGGGSERKNEASSVSSSMPNSVTANANTSTTASTYPVDFEQAWQAYPPRPGASKKEAWKAWRARCKAGADKAALLAGVQRYAAYVAALHTAPQFIKHAATFFGPDEHYKADWSIKARASPGPGAATTGNRHNGFEQINYQQGIAQDGSF
ncbi:hypothetical protein [Undibacterium sp. TJN19]|uniref:hypothetical protein n=1 Tax=Undibacterium sp. TJN19 TaxID=3413055 RepID=UPI003BF443C5